MAAGGSAGSILDQVARAVGVSRRTVIRVLAGGMEHSRPTARARAEQIRQLAETLGYRPNAAAKAVSTGRHHAVSFLTPTELPLYISPGILAGIEDRLTELGMRLVLARAPLQALEAEAGLPQVLREQASDGFLFNSVRSFGPRVDAAVQRYRIPAISVNAIGGYDCVGFEDRAGAVEITRRALAVGHRRIAYVQRQWNDAGHVSQIEREAGYRQAMAEAGLEPEVLALRHDPSTGEDPPSAVPLESIRDTLRRSAATAFVTYDLPTADVLITALLLDGRRIPADVSVLSLDVIGQSRTGIQVDLWLLWSYELGRTAADMIQARIAAPERRLRSRYLGGRYVPGQTLGPPRRT